MIYIFKNRWNDQIWTLNSSFPISVDIIDDIKFFSSSDCCSIKVCISHYTPIKLPNETRKSAIHLMEIQNLETLYFCHSSFGYLIICEGWHESGSPTIFLTSIHHESSAKVIKRWLISRLWGWSNGGSSAPSIQNRPSQTKPCLQSMRSGILLPPYWSHTLIRRKVVLKSDMWGGSRFKIPQLIFNFSNYNIYIVFSLYNGQKRQ